VVTRTPTERDGEGPWARLRRRKVVQWGIAYAAGAWALMQGVAYFRDTFGWPYQIQQLGTLLLLTALPMVLVVAWYHGDRGQQHVTRPELALLTALLVLGGALLWWLGRMVEDPQARGMAAEPAASQAPGDVAADGRSIAVLPFVNMSSDPEQEYFSDGISEQVLDLLSRIPDLRVIARTSSFTFKGKDVDIATIARKLNVSHVLEGSVRKSGNSVRITAQLVRAMDSSQLWSETYDRELTDIFVIQDEIAAAVVQQLKVTLLGGDLPARSATTSIEAYNAYLQGRYLFDRHSEEDMTRAAAYYRRAVAMAPSYAVAWADLADVQWTLADQGYREVSIGAREALASAQKALELDPELARAHSVIGMVRFAYDWDWPAADTSFRRALARDPGDAGAMIGAGRLALALGRPGDATKLFQQAVARNPVNPEARIWLGDGYAMSNRLDEAENEIRSALELSRDYASGWFRLGVVLLRKGQHEAALEAMQKEPAEIWRLPGLVLVYQAMNRRTESDNALREATEKCADTMAFQIAEAHAYRGEVDETFAWLARADHQRDPGLVYLLRTDPLLESVKRDPRYAALVRKLKLSEP